MEQKLIEFIKKEFFEDPDIELGLDTKLISSGLIDSFSLISLQTFIAREFGKNVPAPKITEETFDTINKMIEVINKF